MKIHVITGLLYWSTLDLARCTLINWQLVVYICTNSACFFYYFMHENANIVFWLGFLLAFLKVLQLSESNGS